MIDLTPSELDAYTLSARAIRAEQEKAQTSAPKSRSRSTGRRPGRAE